MITVVIILVLLLLFRDCYHCYCFCTIALIVIMTTIFLLSFFTNSHLSSCHNHNNDLYDLFAFEIIFIHRFAGNIFADAT